jgi:hypothetical protein
VSTLPIDIEEFKQFLEKRSVVSKTDLDNILKGFMIDINPNILIDFYLLRCTRDSVREDDFVNFLLDYLIPFTLTYSETHPPTSGLTGEEINNNQLKNAARYFLKAQSYLIKKSKKTGELGELFLFIALESRGFIQLLNKMSLKTNSEMPVHGFDAIHIGVNDRNELIIYYGYSKLIKSYAKALDSAMEEIDKYWSSNEKASYEFNIVSSHIDSGKFDLYTEQIKRLISPYEREKTNLGKAHAIFLGYEWKEMGHQKPAYAESLDAHLTLQYQKIIANKAVAIERRISKLPCANRSDFYICVLPFANIDYVRTRFRSKLAYSNGGS